MTGWPIDPIPDQDSLFYRVPVAWLRADQKVQPSQRLRIGKYSTAAKTRERPGNAERFGVLKMLVGKIREIDGLVVARSPLVIGRIPMFMELKSGRLVFKITGAVRSGGPRWSGNRRLKELYCAEIA